MNDFTIAALFDMDGVLVDNYRYHADSWVQFAARYERTVTPEQYARYINGRVASDSMPYVMQRDLLPDEIVTLTEEKEEIYRALYAPDLAPTPGLIPFLQSLQAHKVRMAVGTSAPVSNIAFTLDGAGIRPYFPTVVDASMVRRGKPDPEIYLTAARQLGVPPERCVVFEDAFSGIEAGLRAGMAVVALATTHTRDELAVAKAQLVIDDFTQLTYEGLVRLVEGNWH
ncbi:HAD family hydrolase [Rudanella lutea]|jgi:beta-phosphoglucomutase family hydrolase|uniref:HAD family hydrolase n=1 Tax=Rudanella lutea TaxID=451374 RepID=UPI00037162E9|nr:HAD family phosphatase [Rudanella lutea]